MTEGLEQPEYWQARSPRGQRDSLILLSSEGDCDDFPVSDIICVWPSSHYSTMGHLKQPAKCVTLE